MEQEVTVKKRVRPTWKQVHELEAKIRELEQDLTDARVELLRLRNRSFLERVFNK